MAIPFVILSHFIGSENHVSMIYDEKKKPVVNKDNKLTVISCNTCLMPEGLARANNLPFVEERLVTIIKCHSEAHAKIATSRMLHPLYTMDTKIVHLLFPFGLSHFEVCNYLVIKSRCRNPEMAQFSYSSSNNGPFWGF